MKLSVLSLLVLFLALPLFAADYEQLMLPIAPSVTTCGYHSRYEARLIVFNQHDQPLQRFCEDGDCGFIGAKSGLEMTGPLTGGTPLPRFLYVPAGELKDLRMSLLVESMDMERPEERSFAELPILRASDFRSGKIELFVRIDEGFRQGLRLYGLDGHQAQQIIMRVFKLDTNQLLREETYTMWPVGEWENEAGLQARPSFSMECDLSVYTWLVGQQVRIELEPVDPETKYWAFISVTNNKSQHFYTVTPR